MITFVIDIAGCHNFSWTPMGSIENPTEDYISKYS